MLNNLFQRLTEQLTEYKKENKEMIKNNKKQKELDLKKSVMEEY